jgi:menaquinone-specific isochorismate synthase
LLDACPDPAPLVWVHRGQGLVAWGEAARSEFFGPQRFEQAAQWWREVSARAHAQDGLGVMGSGPIAFGTFTFDDQSPEPSVLIVPAHVAGRRDGQDFLTTITATVTAADAADAVPTDPPAARPVGPHLAVSPTRVAGPSRGEWAGVVREALARIAGGQVEKVVLAREEWVRAQRPIEVPGLLGHLAAHYPQCWTFHVDGLCGATPELLVRSARGLVTSRVLAGTIRRTGDDAADLARAGALARSSKDLQEHRFAVDSVAEALAPFVAELAISEAPYVLHLANVMHLATDVVGDLVDRGSANEPSSIELAGALHPTAAVCGTPRNAALEIIRELERTDRGRYSGPVGWMGANGHGEWGIALRCAQLNPDARSARLLAGGGIVAASIPNDELAETDAKLEPMFKALATQAPQRPALGDLSPAAGGLLR